MRLLSVMASGLCLSLHLALGYADEAPDRVVMRVTDEVMRIVRTDKQLRDGDLLVAASVVETLIAPRFDFPRLAAGVMLKDWLSASPAQRERLAEGLRTLLVQTLAVSLSSLTDEKIVLERSIVHADGRTAVVRCKVLSPGEEAVGLEYELGKVGADWMAYEMKIGGVSLTAMYREQFARVVRTRGIDGLIAALDMKNANAVRVSKVAPAAKAPNVVSLPAAVAAPAPAAPPVSPAKAAAATQRRVDSPRRPEYSGLRTAVKGPCVYKSVMSDEDIANCR